MEKFNASIGIDQRLYAQDIDGSIAYAKANVATGILTDIECEAIVTGLAAVKLEWETGSFIITPSDEDIHTANERRLTEMIGPQIGGKLHTGRSRNDQVATDTRLWTVSTERKIVTQLAHLLLTGANAAKQDVDYLMAGYTHLQPAQPIRYSHWLCSHLFPLVRDAERLLQLIPRANVCPLGSGALAGNAFQIDRKFLAHELHFDSVTHNSLDAVADRDFVVEFLFWSSLFHTHLSQFAEDVIIQNMLKTITIADAYATGSSLMPQKKNPDALELLRGKAGLALGRLVSLSTTLKGLPRAYNKDLQDDKTLLFAAVDTVQDCIAIATGVMATMTPHKDKLLNALSPEMLATDLADYLVRLGVPFRETHHIAGAAVRVAEENNLPLDQLTLEQLQSTDARITPTVMEVWNYEISVERKNCSGGTAKAAVLAQIDTIEAFATSLLSQQQVQQP
jgi:argininosuccinate lyase